MKQLHDWLEGLLAGSHIAESWLPGVKLLILLVALILAASLAYVVTKTFVSRFLHAFFKKTKVTWDDVLADQKTFDRLSHIIPAVIVRAAAPALFAGYGWLQVLMVKVADVYIMIAATFIVISFLKAAEYLLSQSPAFAGKPIASYFQLIRIVLYIALFIVILSVLIGRSPLYFLSAFGAMTAILLLIFKDTILGLVASVQISANDVVRVGDWVEMPKFNADGDVIAINLNTVKIRNWDKTITAVPTFHFMSDSFKNWRGMQESGGRRIKRALYINLQSVKFVDPETRERFKSFSLISDYVTQRQAEIERYNLEGNFDTSQLINGRRMTNIGVFRKYIELYIRNHPSIRKDMTILVRQLPIQESGLPIEIYCFTNTTAWVEYESIQSDLFDHLLAAAKWFELELFQQPSGSDISAVVHSMTRP